LNALCTEAENLDARAAIREAFERAETQAERARDSRARTGKGRAELPWH
jgi:hypothetical protein